MFKIMRVAVLGLVAASMTFSAMPKANALISTTQNEPIETTSTSDSPLLARTYRRVYRVRRVRRVRYRRRPRKVRRYRVCRYRYRYRRGSRYRYRVCRYYRRYYR